MSSQEREALEKANDVLGTCRPWTLTEADRERWNDARRAIEAALAARETEKTVWTCMSCGEIGEGQSCGNCGHEAMPGRWLEARGVERQLKDAWRQRDEALATREEPQGDDAVCQCGHIAHWHGDQGKGACEHDEDCACAEFSLQLLSDTIICCDHGKIATAHCEMAGDGLVTLGELIESYSNPPPLAAREDTERRDGGEVDLHNALLEINMDWSDWGEAEALKRVLQIADDALWGRPQYPLDAREPD